MFRKLARHKSKITLDQFINSIPGDERQRIEDHINDLQAREGYGELTFLFVKGRFNTWKGIEERKIYKGSEVNNAR